MRKVFQREKIVADDSSISIITQYHRYLYFIGDYIIIDTDFDKLPQQIFMDDWNIVE